MSLATTTIPRIKIPNSSSSSCSTSSSSSFSSTFRFSSRCTSSTSYHYSPFTVRNSQADGPLRRPVAPSPPSLKPPPSMTPPPPTPPSSSSPPVTVEEMRAKGVVTLEFQRQKAKELQEYFKKKKLEAAAQGPAFGFVAKNEIGNGRWAMFGFAVGLLTEFATGSDFVDQVKILLSNFGIVDLE